MSYLKLPSQKILAKHLKLCTESTTAAISSGEQCLWKCQLGDRSFTILPCIWIQGIVVEVKDDGQTVVVDDGTGIVILSQCDKVCSKLSVKKGMYILAVGILQSSGQHSVMNPIKLQDLSDTDHADTMWLLEVIDQMNFLKN